jgi:hypothetical protein
LGKSQPNPWKYYNYVSTYLFSLEIDNPLTLVMMKSPKEGNPGDPRWIDMESEMMISKTHIGQVRR